MAGISRRRFMKGTATTLAAIGAGAAASGALRSPSDKANDKLVVGVIGLGGRGRGHAGAFARYDDTEVAYVCDVDEERIGRFQDQIERTQGKRPKAVQDLRRMLDDDAVDVVVIATCDHWHALATVWACQAGKDVYVEKPPSHNIWEGRKMVEAARKYNRIVQTGTQNRSAPYIQAARDYIRAGHLGDIPLVKVYNLESGGPFRCPEDSPKPPGVDYGMYLGPAPDRPFNEGHFHKGWKLFWAYGGGDMADDGVHQLDIGRLLIGDPAYPESVNATGGNLAWDDDRETPDTQVVSYRYPDTVMTFELSQFAAYMAKTPGSIRMSDEFPYWPQNASRVEVYGTKEQMVVGRHGGGWQVFTSRGRVKQEQYGREETDAHRRNFVDCVRSRELPNADIETGHRSAVLAHLGNIGVRAGGVHLEFDAATERITNHPEADALVKRSYRAPYVIPESV